MNDGELDKLRRAGAIAARALRIGCDMADVGVKLIDVAEEIEGYIIAQGAMPAFPVNLSINEVAAHYTPKANDRSVFDAGDVIKIDVGAHIDGHIGDTAATVEVGSRRHKGMIGSAEKARDIVMEIIGDGISLGHIGQAVESSIKADGFLPVANLTGHEVRQYDLHAGLTVPSVDDGNEEKVRDGMVLAVEPFVTNGDGLIKAGRGGNIYRLRDAKGIRDDTARDLYDSIKEQYGSLPFCDRWIEDAVPRPNIALNKLVRTGAVSGYATLVEVKRGCVTQSEHTVVIRGRKGEITTLP